MSVTVSATSGSNASREDLDRTYLGVSEDENTIIATDITVQYDSVVALNPPGPSFFGFIARTSPHPLIKKTTVCDPAAHLGKAVESGSSNLYYTPEQWARSAI